MTTKEHAELEKLHAETIKVLAEAKLTDRKTLIFIPSAMVAATVTLLTLIDKLA